MARNAGAKNFEASLQQLERIVRDMETGDLPLERSLELFEQGVKLSRECQERLNEAERRIEVLLRDGEGRHVIERLSFDDEEDGEAPAEDNEDNAF